MTRKYARELHLAPPLRPTGHGVPRSCFVFCCVLHDAAASSSLPDVEGLPGTSQDASKVTVRSGESIEAFVHALAPLADALLVNCSTPEDTTVAVKCIRDALEAHHVGAGAPHRRPISIGAYGNRMEPVEEDWVFDWLN